MNPGKYIRKIIPILLKKKMILNKILVQKRKEIEQAKAEVPQNELVKKISGLSPRRGFKLAISRAHQINLVAEIKKASPSRGIIREDFNPVKISQFYQNSGARAVSVLTDEQFFKGSLEYLSQIRQVITLPILRKEFIIDEYQIYQSVLAGADAILLIAAVLSREQLTSFSIAASQTGMDVIVEVHSEQDVEKILPIDPPIIGINNRDLISFELNLDTTERLVRLLPRGKIIISESGIKTHQDVMRLKSLGVNAVLIGETFMESEDIGAKVKEVMGY
ncbi:MAG: indole-3-glycerol phosphate synthase TrpC [Candidatus Omnitrophota bacterium]|nr:indole-3-glycerol phosphate synthase TrpC [Candidatus Omnitrophota bacterium]